MLDLVPLATIPTPIVVPHRTPDAGSSDDALVTMWLHGKSAKTQAAYLRTITSLRAFTGKSFAATGLCDLQDYVATLGGKATSRATAVASLKSFFSFGNKLGALYLRRRHA